MKIFKVTLLFSVFGLFLISGCTPRSTTSHDSPEQVTSIENKGSDTIVNLALAWAEEYQVINPDVRLSVTGGGSGTGIAA